MKHTDIINSLDLEQKCALLSGGTVFTTRALPGKGCLLYTSMEQNIRQYEAENKTGNPVLDTILTAKTME